MFNPPIHSPILGLLGSPLTVGAPQLPQLSNYNLLSLQQQLLMGQQQQQLLGKLTQHSTSLCRHADNVAGAAGLPHHSQHGGLGHHLVQAQDTPAGALLASQSKSLFFCKIVFIFPHSCF